MSRAPVRLRDDPKVPTILRDDLARATRASVSYDKEKGLARLEAALLDLASSTEDALSIQAKPETVAPAHEAGGDSLAYREPEPQKKLGPDARERWQRERLQKAHRDVDRAFIRQRAWGLGPRHEHASAEDVAHALTTPEPHSVVHAKRNRRGYLQKIAMAAAAVVIMTAGIGLQTDMNGMRSSPVSREPTLTATPIIDTQLWSAKAHGFVNPSAPAISRKEASLAQPSVASKSSIAQPPMSSSPPLPTLIMSSVPRNLPKCGRLIKTNCRQSTELEDEDEDVYGLR